MSIAQFKGQILNRQSGKYKFSYNSIEVDDKIFKYDELQFDKFEDLKEIENHCVLVLDFSGTFELVGINYWKGIEGKIKQVNVQCCFYGIYQDEIIELSQLKLQFVKNRNEIIKNQVQQQSQFEQLILQGQKNIQRYQQIIKQSQLGQQMDLFVEFHVDNKTIQFVRVGYNQKQLKQKQQQLIRWLKNETNKNENRFIQSLFQTEDISIISQINAKPQFQSIMNEQLQFVSDIQNQFLKIQVQSPVNQLQLTYQNNIKQQSNITNTYDTLKAKFNDEYRVQKYYTQKNRSNSFKGTDTSFDTTNLQVKLREKQQVITMLENKIEEINDIVEAQDQNYQKVKSKFKKLKIQYKQIKQVNQEKGEECEDYKQKLNLLLSEQDEQKNDLQNIMNQYKVFLLDMENYKNMNDLLEREKQKLEDKYQLQSEELIISQQELSNYKKSQQELSTQKQRLEEQLNIFQQSNDQLQKQICKYQNEQQEFNKEQTKLLHEQKQKYELLYQQKEQEINSMSSMLNKLENELTDQKDLLMVSDQQRNHDKEELETYYHDQIQVMNHNLEKKKEKLKKSKQQFKEIQYEYQKIENQLDLTQIEILELKQKIEQQKQIIQEKDRKINDNKELDKSIREQLVIKEKQLKEEQKQKLELQDKLKLKSNELQELQTSNAYLLKEIDNQKQIISETIQRNTATSTKVIDNGRKSNTEQRLSEQQLSQVKQELQQEKQLNEELEHQLTQLTKQYNKLNTEKDKLIMKLHKFQNIQKGYKSYDSLISDSDMSEKCIIGGD